MMSSSSFSSLSISQCCQRYVSLYAPTYLVGLYILFRKGVSLSATSVCIINFQRSIVEQI